MESPTFLGMEALINMILTLLFIAVSWWAVQRVKLDLFVRSRESAQAKVLQLLLAIALGYITASFFIDYIQWTRWLRYLFS